MTDKLLVNIWGKPGCELPDGKLCDACCYTKAIDSPWGSGRFLKAPATDCRLMGRLRGRAGCGVHGVAPDACEIYHCSRDSGFERHKLIDYAEKVKLVAPREANEARKRNK